MSNHIYIGPYFVCNHDEDFLKKESEIIACINKGCSNFNFEVFGTNLGKYCDRCGNKREKTIVKKHENNVDVDECFHKHAGRRNVAIRCINHEIEENFRNRPHIWIESGFDDSYISSGYVKEILSNGTIEKIRLQNSEDYILLQGFYGKENVEIKYGLWFWEENDY